VNILGYLQRLGKSLMLPIATLPIAAILLRFGQPDVLNIPFISAAGSSIFENLPLLFALGIAVGLSKDDAGAAALAGAVGYFVLTKGTEALGNYTEVTYVLSNSLDQAHSYIIKDSGIIAKLHALTLGTSSALDASGKEIAGSIVQSVTDVKLNLSFFGGVIAGIVAGHSYNAFSGSKLPDYLAFFGGKRLVPIMTGLFCLILALVCGEVWPYVQSGINAFSQFVSGSGAIGEFVYGVMNRALIPFGLHYILHSVFWFGFLGECTKVSYEFAAAGGTEVIQHFVCLDPAVVKNLTLGGMAVDANGAPIAGSVVTEIAQAITRGDLNRFFAGDPSAGVYMAWAYPIFMFGLPGAALAMYFAAPKKNRSNVGGLLLSVALTSFLTGITEPIEFTFMFLAPMLYVVHAILAGISMVVVNSFGILHGFGFSAGLIDYGLNWGLATKPELLIPIGLAFGVIYFVVFYFSIKIFNIKTPGREDDETSVKAEGQKSDDLDLTAENYLKVVGGTDNLRSIDACITRLRLTVDDTDIIDEAAAKRLGAAGVIKLNKQSVQIVVGAKAESIADAMKRLVERKE
jgi:PTS system N-acetylglucosamine-specific IIC component